MLVSSTSTWSFFEKKNEAYNCINNESFLASTISKNMKLLVVENGKAYACMLFHK